jgi:hypothetical protein
MSHTSPPPAKAARFKAHRNPSAAVLWLAAAAGSLAGQSARADPGYYVVTAYDNAGQVTVESRYWDVRFSGRRPVAWPEAGFSLGVNSRWTTGLLWSWIGPAGGPFALSTFNWTNDVLLTQGNWPVDVAVHTQWVRELADRGGGSLDWGAVMQTDIGRTQVNLNLLLERGLGNDKAQPTEFKYQWQLRHRWQPGVHLGLQGFGELGPWDRWLPAAQQSQRVGPAVFSTWHGQQTINLSAAWLQGRVYGKRSAMLSVRAALSY